MAFAAEHDLAVLLQFHDAAPAGFGGILDDHRAVAAAERGVEGAGGEETRQVGLHRGLVVDESAKDDLAVGLLGETEAEGVLALR